MFRIDENMNPRFRIYDKYKEEYTEEPYYRITLAENGMVYNSELDKWYEEDERYEIELATGKFDKNGNEFYETDHVKYSDGIEGEVYYCKQTASWRINLYNLEGTTPLSSNYYIVKRVTFPS